MSQWLVFGSQPSQRQSSISGREETPPTLTNETQTSSNDSAAQIFNTQPPSIVGIGGHSPPSGNSMNNRLGAVLANRITGSRHNNDGYHPAVTSPSLAERLLAAQLRRKEESVSYIPPEPIPEELLQYAARGRRQSSTPQIVAREEATTPLSSGPRSRDSSLSAPGVAPQQQKPRRGHQPSYSDSSASRFKVLNGGRGGTPQQVAQHAATPLTQFQAADRRRSSGSSKSFNSSQATPTTNELTPHRNPSSRGHHQQQRRSSPGHEFLPRRTSLSEVIGAASNAATPKARPQAPGFSDEPNPSFAVSQPTGTESQRSSNQGNYEQATTTPTTASMYTSRGSQPGPSVSDDVPPTDVQPVARHTVAEATALRATPPPAAVHHAVPDGRRTSEAHSSHSLNFPQSMPPRAAGSTPLLEVAKGKGMNTAEGSQVGSSITEVPGGRGRSIHETTTTAYSEELSPSPPQQLPPFPPLTNRRETLPNAVEDMNTFRFPAEASTSNSHHGAGVFGLGASTDTEERSFRAARKLSSTIPRNTGMLPPPEIAPEIAEPSTEREASTPSTEFNRNDSGGGFPSRLHTHTISPSDATPPMLVTKSTGSPVVAQPAIHAEQGIRQESMDMSGMRPSDATTNSTKSRVAPLGDEAFGDTVATVGADSSPSYPSLPFGAHGSSQSSPPPPALTCGSATGSRTNSSSLPADLEAQKPAASNQQPPSPGAHLLPPKGPGHNTSGNTDANPLATNVSTGPEDTTNTTTNTTGSSGYAAGSGGTTSGTQRGSSKSNSDRTPSAAPLPPLANGSRSLVPRPTGVKGQMSNSASGSSASESLKDKGQLAVKEEGEVAAGATPLISLIGGILEMLDTIRTATDILDNEEGKQQLAGNLPKHDSASAKALAPLSLHSLDSSYSGRNRGPAGMVDTPRPMEADDKIGFDEPSCSGVLRWLQGRRQNSSATFDATDGGRVHSVVLDSPAQERLDSPLTPPRATTAASTPSLPYSRPPMPNASTRTSLSLVGSQSTTNNPQDFTFGTGGNPSGQSSASNNGVEGGVIVLNALATVGATSYSNYNTNGTGNGLNSIPHHKSSLNANSSTTGSDIASIHPDRFAQSIYSVGSQTFFASGVNGDSFPSAIANSPGSASMGTVNSVGATQRPAKHFHKTHFHASTPHLSDGMGRMFMALRSNFEASHQENRDRLKVAQQPQATSTSAGGGSSSSPRAALATPNSEVWGGSLQGGSKGARQPQMGSSSQSQRLSGLVGSSSTDIESNISPRDQALPAPLATIVGPQRADTDPRGTIYPMRHAPIHTPSDRDTPAAGPTGTPSQRMQNSVHSFETSSGGETLWNIPSGQDSNQGDLNATSTSASKGAVGSAKNTATNNNNSSEGAGSSSNTNGGVDSPNGVQRQATGTAIATGRATTSSWSSGSGRPPHMPSPSKASSSSKAGSVLPLPRQNVSITIPSTSVAASTQKDSTSSYFADYSTREILGANASASTAQTATTPAATTPMQRPPMPAPATASAKISPSLHPISGKGNSNVGEGNDGDEKVILVGSDIDTSLADDQSPGTSLQENMLSFPLAPIAAAAGPLCIPTPGTTLNDSMAVGVPGMLSALASSGIRMGIASATPPVEHIASGSKTSSTRQSSANTSRSLMPTMTVSPSMLIGEAQAAAAPARPIEIIGTNSDSSSGAATNLNAPLATRLQGFLKAQKAKAQANAPPQQQPKPDGSSAPPASSLAARLKARLEESSSNSNPNPNQSILISGETPSLFNLYPDQVEQRPSLQTPVSDPRQHGNVSIVIAHSSPSLGAAESGNSSYQLRAQPSSTERDTLGAKLASSSGTITDQNSRRQSGGTSGTNASTNASFANNNSAGSPTFHSTPKKGNLIPPSMHALRPTSPTAPASMVHQDPLQQPQAQQQQQQHPPIIATMPATAKPSLTDPIRPFLSASVPLTTITVSPSDTIQADGNGSPDRKELSRSKLSSSMSHSQHSQHSRRVNPSGVASPTQQLLQPRYGHHSAGSKGAVSPSGSGIRRSPSVTSHSKPSSPHSPLNEALGTVSTNGTADETLNTSMGIPNNTPMARVLQRVMSAGGDHVRSPTSPSGSMHRSFGSVIRSPRNTSQPAPVQHKPSHHHASSNSTNSTSGSTQPPPAGSSTDKPPHGRGQVQSGAAHIQVPANLSPKIEVTSNPNNASNTTNSSASIATHLTSLGFTRASTPPPTVINVRSTSSFSDGPAFGVVGLRPVTDVGSPHTKDTVPNAANPTIHLPEMSLAATSSNASYSVHNAFSSGSSHGTVNPSRQGHNPPQSAILFADSSSPSLGPNATADARATHSYSVSSRSGAPPPSHTHTPMTEHSATNGVNVSSTSIPLIAASITDPTIPFQAMLDSTTTASASHRDSEHQTGTQTGNSSPRYLAGTLTKEPTPEPHRHHVLPPHHTHTTGGGAINESYSPPPRRGLNNAVPPPLLQVPRSPSSDAPSYPLPPPPVNLEKLSASKDLLDYLRTEDHFASAKRQAGSMQEALQIAEAEVAKLNIKFYLPVASVCDMDRLVRPSEASMARQLSNASEAYDPFGTTYTSLAGSSLHSRMHSPRGTVVSEPMFSSRPTSPAGALAVGGGGGAQQTNRSRSPMSGRPPIGPHSVIGYGVASPTLVEGVQRTGSVAGSHRSVSRKSSAGAGRLRKDKDEAIMAANPQYDWTVLVLKEGGRATKVTLGSLPEYIRLASVALSKLELGAD